MKVLLANKFFFMNGGSEAVFFREREYLRSLGVQVVDFSMRDRRNLPSAYESYFVANRDFRGESSKIQRLASAVSLVHSGEAVRNFSRLLESEKPDIVHCHNIYHQLTPSIIGAAKRRSIPVVLTAHDYKVVCPIYVCQRDEQVCTECVDHGFGRVVLHRCAGKSLGRSALLYLEATVQRLLGSYELLDTVLAPSDFMRDLLTRRRFPKHKVTVLRNGIDVVQTGPSWEDGNYILYFGRLSREKGVRTLLDAYSSVSLPHSLVIAGTGPLEAELRAEYPSVTFLGHLSGSRLDQVISAAAVVVVPSEWYENCPMSILEAMAHGKPVVGSRIGGIPELIEPEETGVLFDAGNAQMLGNELVRLCFDRAMRQRMGEAGRRRVEERFSIQRHNRALVDIYSALLDRKSHR